MGKGLYSLFIFPSSIELINEILIDVEKKKKKKKRLGDETLYIYHQRLLTLDHLNFHKERTTPPSPTTNFSL